MQLCLYEHNIMCIKQNIMNNWEIQAKPFYMKLLFRRGKRKIEEKLHILTIKLSFYIKTYHTFLSISMVFKSIIPFPR